MPKECRGQSPRWSVMGLFQPLSFYVWVLFMTEPIAVKLRHMEGLVHPMPYYAAAFMFFVLASVALPGTSGFVGEFLVLVGVYQVNTYVTVFATLGMVLGVSYALWLYRRVIFGVVAHQNLKGLPDLNWREQGIFVPFAVSF